MSGMECETCSVDARLYKNLVRMADAWTNVRLQVPSDAMCAQLRNFLEERGFEWNEETMLWTTPRAQADRWPGLPEEEALYEFSD